MDEWRLQREKFLDCTCTDIMDKGFATLFLNRTNRSGILRGGVIGGKFQEGNYKLDCRFNKLDLIRKIRRIALHKDQISLSCLDAAAFVTTVVPHTSEYTLINLDPPYYGKGPELYTNFYKPDDHASLANAVASIERHWMVTYDDTPEIRTLYDQYPMYGSSLNYSAQVKRIGLELLVMCPETKLPKVWEESRIGAPKLRRQHEAQARKVGLVRCESVAAAAQRLQRVTA